MGILKSLENAVIVKEIEVIEFKIFKSGFYIKIKTILTNETELYIREYSDETRREYSYHWQTSDNKLILRWDNAPYHRELPTFPHHKHTTVKVFPSFEITIDKVLSQIEKEINKKDNHL